MVSFNDAEVVVFDTKSGEEIIAMASQETYDGTPATGVNSIVATTTQVVEGGGDAMMMMGRGGDDEGKSRIGVEGVILSGHEDRFVRFFDASSGMSPSFLSLFFLLTSLFLLCLCLGGGQDC